MWKTMSKNNNKILEARLTRLETRQEEIQNDIKEIKEQVFNALPHKIDELESRFITGLIIAIISFIVVQLLLRLF